MPSETLALLNVRAGGQYVDCTFGGGGHTSLILQQGGNVLGIDRDPAALARGKIRFHKEIETGRLRLAHANHGDLREVANAEGVREADGILLDLGVSSDQLDDPARGFSFQKDGPLDLRMDTTAPFSAADLVATASEGELAKIFRELGEEPQAKKFARAIVRARESQHSPVKTTARLATIGEIAAGGRCGLARHPATRVFQSLRMAVNREMEALQGALDAGLGLLAPNGRMVVIAFES
jgi:16S rRNA (cytosine1402-N4)-methyltransferase